jgi:diguanylate cyclase (GGDEF)-like protein
VHAIIISDAVATADLVVASTDSIRGALYDAGYSEVTRVRSAHEALSCARLDLVVLDLVEAPSFDSYRRLIGRLHGAPIIAILDELAMAVAFDAGVDDCVARPVRRTELLLRARAALHKRLERERRTKRDRKMSDTINTLQQEKHDLERIVCVDSLTGIANRRHALLLLDAEWKRSARDGTSLSLVMIDLDCFHAFNATYGHPGGDACLRRVTAEMVTSLRRPSDFLGRYGGEEFLAVLATTDAAGAQIVAERLRACVEGLAIPHASSRCSNVVTISVGFATAHPDADTTSGSLIAVADEALLQDKTQGRNRVAGDAPEPTGRVKKPSAPWRRFPIVVVDPWFADRVPQFLEATRGEIAQVREALDTAHYDRIRSVARRLRASAGDHAIQAIVELANLLERTARSGDADAARRVADEIEQYVVHVQVAYRRPAQAG